MIYANVEKLKIKTIMSVKIVLNKSFLKHTYIQIDNQNNIFQLLLEQIRFPFICIGLNKKKNFNI